VVGAVGAPGGTDVPEAAERQAVTFAVFTRPAHHTGPRSARRSPPRGTGPAHRTPAPDPRVGPPAGPRRGTPGTRLAHPGEPGDRESQATGRARRRASYRGSRAVSR
jgi:hypothetical protein